MDDVGDAAGWPNEGFCLVTGGDQRARPAWLCRELGSNGRRKVLVYGESSVGGARDLSTSECVEQLPADTELAKRLQRDWATATPAARDAALNGLDELEARRAAPRTFVDMVSALRELAVLGDTADLVGPSASIGREFYPNLFPPLVGDTVRVLYDGGTWYEAVVVRRRPTDTRTGEPIPKRAQSGAVVACEASYFSPAGFGQLRVRYLADGQHETVRWPDANDEAFLLAQPLLSQGSKDKQPLFLPRRRCSPRNSQDCVLPRDWRPFLAKDRAGQFEAHARAAVFERDVDLGRTRLIVAEGDNGGGEASSSSEEVGSFSQFRQRGRSLLLNGGGGQRGLAAAGSSDDAPTSASTAQAAAPPEVSDMLESTMCESSAPSESNGDARRERDFNRAFEDATADFFALPQQSEASPEEDTKVLSKSELGPAAQAAVRCCLWLKALARPLSALIADFGQLKEALDLAFDDRSPRKDDDDWPFDAPPVDVESPIASLSDLADALSRVLPLAALPDEAFRNGASSSQGGDATKDNWLRRADLRAAVDAHVALYESRHQNNVEDESPPPTQQEDALPPQQDVEETSFASLVRKLAVDLKAKAETVARGWDRSTRSRTLGPGDILAARAPCFATLPRSRVHEPHRSWIRRAQRVARENLEKKQREEESSSEEESDDAEKQEEEESEFAAAIAREERRLQQEQRPQKRRKKTPLKQQATPRRYRPPGASARRLMCGGDELAMDMVPVEIATSLAGGLGADNGPRVDVVTIDEGEMRGERGVVALRDLDRRSVLPYAGVVVTDDELAKLLWRQPRAVSNWLMYRYEFGPQISVLPYLSCPSFSPAPFINCARGPNATDVLIWQSFQKDGRGVTPRKLKKQQQQQQQRSDDDCGDDDDGDCEEEEDLDASDVEARPRWRAWGSDHIGWRVRRQVEASELNYVDGTVVGWLDKDESDFVDDKGAPAALYRVKYDPSSALAGDFEDLELHELLTSAKAAPLENTRTASTAAANGSGPKKATPTAAAVVSSSSEDSCDTKPVKKANCHFEEVLVDGAVLGVYVVATRKIASGEPLLVTYGKEFWSGWVQRRARLADLDRCADGMAAAARALADCLDASDLQSVVALKRDEDQDAEPRVGRHERWRRIVGVPFEAQRAVRGERGRPAVVVGLAVEAPASTERTAAATTAAAREEGRGKKEMPRAFSSSSPLAVGERVEGYWRGSAPSFPATVVAVEGETVRLAYDDGQDEITTRAYARPVVSPAAWRDLPHVPAGTWVRKFFAPGDSPPSTTAKGPASKQKALRRREGVVVQVRATGRIDVLGDDSVLDANERAADWEPLFVTRFAEDHEQRVMGLDQLLYLQPLFLDAARRRPLFPSFNDADAALTQRHEQSPRGSSLALALQPQHPQVDVARALAAAGVPRHPVVVASPKPASSAKPSSAKSGKMRTYF